MKIQAIVAAGGTGERMRSPVPKPLLRLGGVPVVVRTLAVFEGCSLVESCVLVVPDLYIEEYRTAVRAAGLKKVKAVIPGGTTRTGSVREGLRALDRDADMVIVHDAVRPFVTAAMICKGVETAAASRAAIAGVPVKSTLKVVDPATHLVNATLDRSLVWEVQTPQVFDRALLDEAYVGENEATDDAALVEEAGVPVKVFMGSYRNIKITTPEDMEAAEAFLKGDKG